MEWAQEFYSVTGRWWGAAESAVVHVDRERAAVVAGMAQPEATLLELGCGYGSTAIACADAGFAVTGIDFSDRLDRAPRDIGGFVKADFYQHNFAERFDVVTYWDGFGIGTDADQRRLLDRIGNDWLVDAGIAIIEVMDPTGWAADHGLTETRSADPQRGYHQHLGHRRMFDRSTNTAVDTWWEVNSEIEWSQTLRCYSPADFAALVAETSVQLVEVLDIGRSAWSYIAVLKPSSVFERVHDQVSGDSDPP